MSRNIPPLVTLAEDETRANRSAMLFNMGVGAFGLLFLLTTYLIVR